MLLRMCRVKNCDIEAATKLHSDYRTLCKKKDYHLLKVSDVETQLRTETLLIPGACDLYGNPCMYMTPGNYDPSNGNLEKLLESLVYLLEDMTTEGSRGARGVAVMANMTGLGWSSFSVSFAKSVYDIIQGVYPIRNFVIMNPPSWFNAMWRLIRPLMGTKSAEKVHLVSDDAIYEYVDKASLPLSMGGGSNYSSVISDYIAKKRAEEAAQ